VRAPLPFGRRARTLGLLACRVLVRLPSLLLGRLGLRCRVLRGLLRGGLVLRG